MTSPFYLAYFYSFAHGKVSIRGISSIIAQRQLGSFVTYTAYPINPVVANNVSPPAIFLNIVSASFYFFDG